MSEAFPPQPRSDLRQPAPSPPCDGPAPFDAPPGDVPTAVRMLLSQDLFGGSREVCIAHRGSLYRLRITMQNRLILQK